MHCDLKFSPIVNGCIEEEQEVDGDGHEEKDPEQDIVHLLGKQLPLLVNLVCAFPLINAPQDLLQKHFVLPTQSWSMFKTKSFSSSAGIS